MASRKNTLRQIFGNDFSKSSFKKIDGEYRIVGKYGEIALNDDGSFDCWLVSQDRSPFTTRFVNSRIKQCGEAPWRILTGEAHYQTTDPDLIRKSGSLLGIRKRYHYTEEQLAARRERFKKNTTVETK